MEFHSRKLGLFRDADAEDQIGSVFAVQGIDLNKVGVLVGNDLQVDKRADYSAIQKISIM